MKSDLYAIAAMLAVVGAIELGPPAWKGRTVAAATVMAPRFEVNLTWSKPLPNHWILGKASAFGRFARSHLVCGRETFASRGHFTEVLRDLGWSCRTSGDFPLQPACLCDRVHTACTTPAVTAPPVQRYM